MTGHRIVFLMFLLSGCDQAVLMRGYVDVSEPGGAVQKVQMVCRRIYDPDSRTLSITGVTLPVNAVIKPQIGGISMGDVAAPLTDQIRGMDLQQIALCESLILDPAQADIRQAFKDYIGVDGYLTQQIRTLNSSTSLQQYRRAAADLIARPAIVAPLTAEAARDVTARFQAPALRTFAAQPGP